MNKVTESQVRLFQNATDSVLAICKILEELHIGTFTFLERFSNGEIVYFSNSKAWLLDYFTKNLGSSSPFDCDNSLYQELEYIIWPEDSTLEVYKYGRDHHDSDHGITIIKQHPDSTRYFFFSTSRNFPQIRATYAKHLDALKRFAAFFEQEAAAQIEYAHMLIEKPRKKKITPPPNHTLKNFYAKTVINTNSLILQGVQNTFVKLSSQEWRCLSLLTEHLTTPEIAEKLTVSTRTIETHLNNLKNKLGCHRKTELLEIGLRFKHLFF